MSDDFAIEHLRWNFGQFAGISTFFSRSETSDALGVAPPEMGAGDQLLAWLMDGGPQDLGPKHRDREKWNINGNLVGYKNGIWVDYWWRASGK